MLKNISHKKRVGLLISFLVLLGAFGAFHQAQAIFGIGGVGLFDLATMQLDALDFVDSVVLRFLVFVFILIAESQGFIMASAALLQWAMGLSF